MKCIVQRVSHASVVVAGRETGAISRGLLVLAGIHRDDSEADLRWTADRLVGLRIFPDADGKMNLSVAQVGGGVLLIPNFTLCAQTGKGHRPSFIDAMAPQRSAPMFDALAAAITAAGIPAARGTFGAHMDVTLTNDGPISIILDSHQHLERPA
jgi:D-tyrosyl-tRNA(Tyr) deacylase